MMCSFRNRCLLVLALFQLTIQSVLAQGIAVGQWRTHTAMQDVIAISDAGDRIYTATHTSLFSVMKEDHSIQRFTKATGLSDVAVAAIDFNAKAQVLVIAYQNSNIDLLYPDGHIVNVSDIKRKNIPGNKSINQIFNSGSYCYLACGFGIVVLDLQKLEIKDTYIIGKNGQSTNVKHVAINGSQIMANTADGIAVANYSNQNLANYAFWTYWDSTTNKLPLLHADQIAAFNGACYAAFKNQVGELRIPGYKYDTTYVSTSGWSVKSISSNSEHLIINEKKGADSSRLVFINKTGKVVKRVFNRQFLNNLVAVSEDLTTKELWCANAIGGLVYSKNSVCEFIVPNAPLNNNAYDLEEKNGTIWVAAGSVDNNYSVYLYNPDGFYSFGYENWYTYDRYSYPALANVLDMICVAIDNDNHVYLGSFGKGLVELKDGQVTQHTDDVGLQPMPGDVNSYRVTDTKLDASGNLWMSNYGAAQPLVLKKADGTVVRFNNPYGITQLGKMIIDNIGQLWIIAAGSTGGVIVYNPGTDLTSTADDHYRLLQKGGGVGNLPDTRVTSLALDKDGSVWVGTAAGVGIFYDPASIIEQGEAQQIIVSKDSINAYLLSSEVLNDIQIDGAGRKWFATSHGVYLIAADGLSEICHFDEENSPLLSNNVFSIAIQSKSGEVFFGTQRGICSFKSTATAGGEKNESVLVYPNPVPHNYNGMIAINGLVENAFVKITDINGTLIYSTKALGGQAVWDGKNLSGEKTASGVYLVFATNSSGSETIVSKLLYEK